MSHLADLQRALELAHYARRWRGQRFVVALGGRLTLADVMLDVRLFGAYGLAAILVVRSAGGRTVEAVSRARSEGLPFVVVDADAGRVDDALQAGLVPVVVTADPTDDTPPGPAKATAARLAVELGARRLLLAIRGARRPPGPSQVEAGEARGRGGPLWSFVADTVESGVPVVVLPGEPGSLFEELFTHTGAGLLVGHALQEAIRSATRADAAEVELLLKADIARGLIRPASDEELRETIEQHLLYTIDELVVATARLRPWSDAAELSRFATLPRYRGRGRARRLAEALVERARQEGHSRLFALSTHPKMWRFFESLGFGGVDRESLPRDWLAGYDLGRPSRAFAMDLGNDT